MVSQKAEIKTSRHQAPSNRGFITIAYGDLKYLRMGKALARSIRLNSPGSKLAVVTDSDDEEMHTLLIT